MYSLDESTRTKTITVNNQTWTADDSSNPIQNLQTTTTVPNVEITGSTGSTVDNIAYETYYIGTSTYGASDTYWVKAYSQTFEAKAGRIYHMTYAGIWLLPYDGYASAQAQVWVSIDGGAEVQLTNWSEWQNEGEQAWVFVDDVLNTSTTAGQSIEVILYIRTNTAWSIQARYFEFKMEELRANACSGAVLYNTADTTTKLDMCNRLQLDQTLLLNTDGSGTYESIGHFDTSAYIQEAFLYTGLTYSTGYITVGADGYIIYDFDVKYPVIGIPTFTAMLSSFTGTPKVQIATDLAGAPDTFYDITDSLVDGTLTEYDLDSTSLSLAGSTRFYVKILAETSESISISSFTLNANINPSAASFPEIAGSGATNSFRCDQDTTSEMDCSISLIYSERRYG
jgi:hypothetical protein